MSDENQQQQPQRKTLDERAKMSDLERLRRSYAHVLAGVFLNWPEPHFAAGPKFNETKALTIDEPRSVLATIAMAEGHIESLHEQTES